MIIILIIAWICICLLILFSYRNKWVFNQRMKYNSQVFNYRYKLISDNFELYKSTMCCDYRNAIESYNTMLLKFWIWDINKFIINEDFYQEVQENNIQH